MRARSDAGEALLVAFILESVGGSVESRGHKNDSRTPRTDLATELAQGSRHRSKGGPSGAASPLRRGGAGSSRGWSGGGGETGLQFGCLRVGFSDEEAHEVWIEGCKR